MAEIDIERLIWIVTGIQLRAELGDRPLAYRIERALRQQVRRRFGKPKPGELPRLAPAVVSDVYYLNSEEAQSRPTISVGGPGMNALSATLLNELPTIVAIEDVLVIQMDLEMKDTRCAIWGMSHLDTVRAVELFTTKYLAAFLNGVLAGVEE